MRLFYPLFLTLFLLICSQCANNQLKKNNEKTSSPSLLSAKDSQDPEKNYKKYCASCHGAEMKAFVDRKWKKGNSKEDLIRSIKVGIINAGMPAFQETFSDNEIEELAGYILEGVEDRKKYKVGHTVSQELFLEDELSLKVMPVVENLEVPWGVKVDKSGVIYFTERKGNFKIKKPGEELINVKGVPEVAAQIQGGMLDLALHPDFENNAWIYLSYSKKLGGGNKTTAVVRGKVDDDQWTEQEEIFEANFPSDRGYHFGCRMVFDNEGYLFISVGDRGNRDENPQSLGSSCGKIHRIYDDGKIPQDNPFYKKEGAIKSIWAYGNRNPQGLAYDKVNDLLWENEHGPRGGDEQNLIKAGVNYGWPTVSYGINYNGTTFTELTEKEGVEHPVVVWIPSIAPSGMAIVEGSNYEAWTGDLLTGSLRFNYISRVEVKEGEKLAEEKVLEGLGRIRAIEMGRDGFLYVGVEEPGRIVKLIPE